MKAYIECCIYNNGLYTTFIADINDLLIKRLSVKGDSVLPRKNRNSKPNEKNMMSKSVCFERDGERERVSRNSVTLRHASHAQTKQPGLKFGKKILICLSCAMLFAVFGVCFALATYVNGINSKIQDIDEEVLQVLDQPENPKSPFFALILGSDAREEGEAGRSDSMVLARVDPEEQQVAIISIPRDTQVDLPGYGKQKINAAYAYGGIPFAVQAVSELSGVPIAHVFEVDFSGFKEIVDSLGGVSVKVPANTTYKGVDVPEGNQTLNGEQALVFVRCRKTYATGDYQRADNQRQLMIAVAKKVLNSSVSEMPALIDSIASSVKTDMTASEIIDLALNMRSMDMNKINMMSMPSYTGSEDGVSYVYVKRSEWLEMIGNINNGQAFSN